jgi:DNA polymerase
VPGTAAAIHELLEHAIAGYGHDLPLDLPTAAALTIAATPPAAAAADPAAALAALQREVLPCTACKLAHGRTNVVFGEGAPTAAVMFIGEAPGREEDRQGRPFVGPAGQLLDRIIVNAMGLARADVFIANVNKCRPPGNRDPEPDEVAACLPYLRQQVAIIRPRVIVTLGRVATWNLLGVSEPMGRLRGRELVYEGIPVVATWHPAYLLRTPSAKAETWADIKRVNRLLGRPEVPGR